VFVFDSTVQYQRSHVDNTLVIDGRRQCHTSLSLTLVVLIYKNITIYSLDYNLTLLYFLLMFLLSLFSRLLLTIYLLFIFIVHKQP